MPIWPWTRIRQLEQANANLNRRLEQWENEWQEYEDKKRALRNQVETLVRTIRAMDDQIFAMSQCTDWPSMRPHFQSLSDGTTARKVAESDRITSILRPELEKIYGTPQKTLRGPSS